MPSYSLGPLPWSAETLTEAYFNDFQTARKAIQEHPGYRVHSAIKSLRTSYSILKRAVEDLVEAIARFEQASADRRLFGRPWRQNFERLVLSVEKELFATSSAAKALVDHSRNVRRKWPVTDYAERIASSFGKENDFIQDLRDYVNHNRVAPLSWRQRWVMGASGPSTEFNLQREALLRTGKWSATAKTFLKAQPEDINVRSLFEEYLKRVSDFQEWYRQEVEKMNKSDLEDYRGYVKFFNAIESRSFWKSMIQQVLERGLDVYEYLEQYLTPEELKKMRELPDNSAAQVDFLIQLLDEYGACNDALRADLYRAFRVPTM